MMGTPVEDVVFPGPGKVVHSPVYGNYVVATKNIRKGELICSERPLIVAPYPTSHQIPLCLSCNKKLEVSSRCSKCQWSICGPECEQKEIHQHECEIFTNNSVRPRRAMEDFSCVAVLRCLFLRESAPQKWKRVLKLEAHKTTRGKNSECNAILQRMTSFIQAECKLTQYGEDLIDHVVGVLSCNPFSVSLNPYHPKPTLILCDSISLFAHDCKPNTVLSLVNSAGSELESPILEDYPPNSEIIMEMYATCFIKEGAMITHSYIDTNLPVQERRQLLKEMFYFDCNCEMCRSQLIQAETNKSNLMYQTLGLIFCGGMVLLLFLSFVWANY